MNKHTPGPWSYDTYNTVLAKLEGPGVEDGVAVICTIPDHPSEGAYTPEEGTERGWWYSQSEDNAYLIAAAPRMLDALIQADLQIEYLHNKFSETGSGNSVRQQIKAVIRDARGQA